VSFKSFDFVKHRNIFFGLSITLTILGIISLIFLRLNLGIDFASGTRVDIMAKHAISIDKVTATLDHLGLKYERPTLSGSEHNIASVRLPKVLDHQEVAQVKAAFKKAFGVDPSVSTVSPQIGRDLAKNAFWAVLISSLFIIVYVWIRFEFLQGLAAIIALLHDAFFIITVFSLLHIEVNIIFIAAVLTIIGYSINDTIVTFDRIRENMRLRKKKIKTFDELAELVNTSIRQTIVRSINTVMTVLLTVVALMIFGSTEIRTFTIALFVGLICGCYSSIFIASPLWAVLKFKYITRERKKGKKSAESLT